MASNATTTEPQKTEMADNAIQTITSERWVDTPHGRIFAAELPGEDAPVVLMHGFPDNHVIYSRLLPQLAPQRAVAFDFLGYGRSDRTNDPCFAYPDHAAQITAVLDALEIDHTVLVGHDGSGPEAIRYAIEHPNRVSHLVVLNSPFGHRPAFKMPEMTRLLAEPDLASLADDLLADHEKRGSLLQRWGVQWELDDEDRRELVWGSILPQFYGGETQPDALTAIRGWTANLLPSLDEQEEMVKRGELTQFKGAVSVIFGGRDRDLTPALAQEIAALFTDPLLEIIDDATHYPQHDQPDTVAELIKRPI